jgi:hypothetical protein
MTSKVKQVTAKLHDIRPKQYSMYHQEDYRVPQTFGAKMRNLGSDGVMYNSVRHVGGECVGIFSPNALSQAVQSEHYQYQWRKKENRIVHVV